MIEKPFSESCEQNKHVILDVLNTEFSGINTVLEVGSGTGQHAVFFAQQLPHLQWQCSDCAEALAGISAWLDEAALQNTKPPVELDVSSSDWPDCCYDAVFSANAVHIMSWQAVVDMFAGIGNILTDTGVLCLYGPFNYNGNYTSESNARFDSWLKQRDQLSGIRGFEDLDSLATGIGLTLINDHAMPANNRTLVWQRR